MWNATEMRKMKHIFPILPSDKRKYLPLLLLADEQEDMIDRYLGRGEMFVLEDEAQTCALCVVTDEGAGVLEIKNLAVAPEKQKRGYGRQRIEFVAARFSKDYHTLLVGTGDSPLTIPFYESIAWREPWCLLSAYPFLINTAQNQLHSGECRNFSY
jgi:GNAT superfamily N-acetyltransferase